MTGKNTSLLDFSLVPVACSSTVLSKGLPLKACADSTARCGMARFRLLLSATSRRNTEDDRVDDRLVHTDASMTEWQVCEMGGDSPMSV